MANTQKHPASPASRLRGRRPIQLVDALRHLRQDLRFAVRTLRKQPAYLAVAVLSLGFGTGAATTMFSVVEALDIRRLPFRDTDRLVALQLVRNAADPLCP